MPLLKAAALPMKCRVFRRRRQQESRHHVHWVHVKAKYAYAYRLV